MNDSANTGIEDSATHSAGSPSSQDAAPAHRMAPGPGGAALWQWQRKLLPLMTRFLVVLAVTFFILSLVDVYEMRNFVRDEANQSVRAQVTALLQQSKKDPQSTSGTLTVIPQALLLLESEAMDKRYRQASALLLSRIWTRQLSFMTGMVLAFIGAVFILGKLSESKTDAGLTVADLKSSISSSSPGLILAFFGTTLIALSIVVQPKIEVQDRPVYIASEALVQPGGSVSGNPPTSPAPDAGALNPGLK
jgi:tellurite resistance protein TehA-like permease